MKTQYSSTAWPVREFTDRQEPLRLFVQAVEGKREQATPRALVWHGVGGQGKTALCLKFKSHLGEMSETNEIDCDCSVLDFADKDLRDPVDALLQLRLELGGRRRIKFPTFDIAFAQLFLLEHPKKDIRAVHPEFFTSKHETVEDLLEVLGQISQKVGDFFFPSAGMVFKYGTRLAGWLQSSWWKRPSTKKMVNKIGCLAPVGLREAMPSILAFDLAAAAEAEDSPRVVVMMDSYEALWRDSARPGMQTLRTDQWVRTLISEARGILFTLFSRNKLRWKDIEPHTDQYLDQHPLDGLSENDAETFLARCGVDSTSVRARIVKKAQGLPSYLDYALKRFEKMKQTGREPGADDFADTPEEIPERLLDHLTDDEIAVIQLVSYPQEVSEELLSALCRAFLGGVARADWGRLMQHSCMTSGEKTAFLHPVLRASLQAREQRGRPSLYLEIHRWLFEFFNTLANSAATPHELTREHDRALIAAAEHLLMTGSKQVLGWVVEHRAPFYDGCRWRALSVIFDRAADTANSVSSSRPDLDAATFHHRRGYICQRLGKMEEATEYYSTAARIYSALLGPNDPSCANVQHALAEIMVSLNKDKEARELYSEALRRYEAAPAGENTRKANVLLSLFILDEKTGRKEEAESLLRQARRLSEGQPGDEGELQYADFLLRLGRIRRQRGMVDEAEEYFREAAGIYSRFLSELYYLAGYASVLLDLALCAAERGRLTSADECFDQAISEYIRGFGSEHPNLGQVLHIQALFWTEHGLHREKSAAQLERAVRILSESLGDEHQWTRAARQDLRQFDPAQH